MEHELALLSPEKTILTYRLASIAGRVFAHLLDVLIIVAVIVAVGFIVGLSGVLGEGAILLSSTAYMVFLVAFPFLYFILFEAFWNGQTLGKKAMTLRVRMADGTAITPLAAIGRNLLRPADMMPGTYFVGLLAMFTTPKSQRLGDLVSNTVVVYEKRATPYFTPAPHTAGIHPLEAQVGELRGMTLDEYNALRRYCDRFPELTPTAQKKLTEEVWLPIAARRGVEMAPNIHPIYLAEAVVMKYGREHGLL
ncbi:MAG TPA: RDD family protein [Fimbriimonadaceae bacterium]|nr:RDD family protein [Fimbriimonadaceae bacterium]